MKLSTKTRYGTRAMLYLALYATNGPRSVREIAEEQELSPKYLEQLMSDLNAAGLVRSVRGPNGGYALAQPAEAISLRQVFDALEGADALVECTADPRFCNRSDGCVTREVWAQMHRACMDVLESQTLADLAQRARAKQTAKAPMYYI